MATTWAFPPLFVAAWGKGGGRLGRGKRGGADADLLELPTACLLTGLRPVEGRGRAKWGRSLGAASAC